MISQSPLALTDGQLETIAGELREITHGTSWSRTLATGELVLKHFFGGNVDEWRTHRRQKEASIRRLAQRPDCPIGKSALSEAVAIYVARRELPEWLGELTPSHVAIALRLPAVQRVAMLERAVVGAWSVREMRSETLLLKRRSGERRGRPRFSETRAALSHLKTSLDALESGIQMLNLANASETETLSLLDRIRDALDALDSKVQEARSRVTTFAGANSKLATKANLAAAVANGRLAG